MSIVTKSRSLSKAKGKPARTAKRPRRLRAKRLASVPLASLQRIALSPVSVGDGWRIWATKDRVHVDGQGVLPGATKTCQTIQLWRLPFDSLDPATGWYHEVRFVEPGEAVVMAVEVWCDGRCFLSMGLAGGGSRPYAGARVRIHKGIGDVLLAMFPGVVGVPEAPRQEPLAALASGTTPTRRMKLYTFLTTLVGQMSDEQMAGLTRGLCERLETDPPAFAAKVA